MNEISLFGNTLLIIFGVAILLIGYSFLAAGIIHYCVRIVKRVWNSAY